MHPICAAGITNYRSNMGKHRKSYSYFEATGVEGKVKGFLTPF